MTPNESKPEAACYQCGGELFEGQSGMTCADCGARIIPTAIYKAERFMPLRWSRVRKLGQRVIRRWWAIGETRAQRDAELARLGLRQEYLF
jgi:hypothetical protein